MEDSSSERMVVGVQISGHAASMHTSPQVCHVGQQKAYSSVLSWPLDVGGRARAQRRPSSLLQLSFLHIKGCRSVLIISLIW